MSKSDEERGGGIHGDDIGADVCAKGEVAEDGDDFVGEEGGADRGAYDEVHTWLAVGSEFVVDWKDLGGR